MLQNYLPVLVFIVIALGLGAAMILAGSIIGPRRPDSEKLSPTSADSRRSRIRG